MLKKGIIVGKSYISYCMICGKPLVEEHHIFGGPNRHLSEDDGLTIPLCPQHHNSSNMSVHMNKEMKVMSHIIGQLAYERGLAFNGATPDEAREKFRKRYGKSYL